MYTLYVRASREVFIAYVVASTLGSMLVNDARHVAGWARYYWAVRSGK